MKTHSALPTQRPLGWAVTTLGDRWASCPHDQTVRFRLAPDAGGPCADGGPALTWKTSSGRGEEPGLCGWPCWASRHHPVGWTPPQALMPGLGRLWGRDGTQPSLAKQFSFAPDWFSRRWASVGVCCFASGGWWQRQHESKISTPSPPDPSLDLVAALQGGRASGHSCHSGPDAPPGQWGQAAWAGEAQPTRASGDTVATQLGRCPGTGEGCGVSGQELMGGGWRSCSSRGRGRQTAVAPCRPVPQ